MPIVNRFAEFSDEVAAWRRDIHENPEILYEVHRTAAVVAEKLKEFGVDEVVTGIGRTGVVGVIKGRETGSGRVIGLRADMDALPIHEATGAPHASKTPDAMHACGHDGHTAMLLGAAKYLAETRNFDGAVALIFQPAEEGGAGAKEMVDDGMMERFGVQEVYGMHNMPGMALGTFEIRSGPVMAATDEFSITVTGYGGHAAKPHHAVDATLVAAQILLTLQTIVARNVDPIESAILSVTTLNAGKAFNVIPETATLGGTVRTLKPEIRDLMEKRIGEVAEMTAKAFGATAETDYRRHCPVVVNHDEQTAFAASVAAGIVGEDQVVRDTPQIMGGEDFAFMLEARPGAFIFAGQGDTAPLHHPKYDFNDELIPLGCSYWAKLVETAMPLAR